MEISVPPTAWIVSVTKYPWAGLAVDRIERAKIVRSKTWVAFKMGCSACPLETPPPYYLTVFVS